MNDLRNVLPPGVFAAIKKQYREVNPLEPEDFEDFRGDEDSLTGAIGKTIRKAVNGTLGGVSWETRVKKLRGRGPGAPEHEVGADMIVELTVTDGRDNIVAQKGLLAQAKKEWAGTDSKLLEQTRVMEGLAPGGSIVVDYGPAGCVAAIGTDVIRARANRRRLTQDQVRPLGERLGDEFMTCSVGRRDMYYDASRERLIIARPTGIIAPRFFAHSRIRTTIYGVPPPVEDPEE